MEFQAVQFKSLNKILESSFKDHWGRPALSNYQGTTLTYEDVSRNIAMLHLCYEKCGLKKGDKIAICSRNQANWGVSLLSALTYGAVPVPLLHEFKPENIHFLVNHSEAKVLFVDDTVWEGLSENEMPDLKIIFQISTFKYIYAADKKLKAVLDKMEESFAARYPDGFKPSDINYYEDSAEELALINYTSGTSGFSKGVMLPYRSLYTNLYLSGHVAEPQMNSSSEQVAMLPSAHMYGLQFEFLYQVSIGAHVHFLTRVPSPKVIMKAFSEIHPDLIVAVPLIIEKVYKSMIKPIVDKNAFYLNIPILDQIVMKKIRNGMVEAFGGRFEEVILGGAPFNPEVEQFLRRIKFPFTIGYGMTECGPIITYVKWTHTREGSCGLAVPGCEIRIDSVDPESVPGEIQVRGSNLFTGYYKNPEATANAFTEDGWFKTGDMGVMDSDGYLYIKGRSKCMILGPSGQNIYPEELEAIINNVKYVVESLVIEDNGGLTALVYPDFHQAELDGISPRELEARLLEGLPGINKRLPAYAQIRKMEFMPEDFERTPKRNIKRYLYKRV